jgi:hypothetical protein
MSRLLDQGQYLFPWQRALVHGEDRIGGEIFTLHGLRDLIVLVLNLVLITLLSYKPSSRVRDRCRIRPVGAGGDRPLPSTKRRPESAYCEIIPMVPSHVSTN